MIIRNIRIDDFFRFNRMDWSPLPKERDSIYVIICANHAECSFIAEEEGEFVGVLLATRSADGEAVYCNHLLVAEKARQKGVGGRLIERLETYAAQAGIGTIWFHCQDETVEYYQSKGYRESYELFPELKDYLRETKKVHTMVKHLRPGA